MNDKNIFANYAMKYWESGISVMPVRKKGICIDNWSRFCKQLPNEEEKNILIDNYYDWNISICCGPASKLIAIDIDLYKDTEDYNKLFNLVPKTISMKIGQKGITSFFKVADERIVSKKIQKILDIQYDGTHTVIPPSIHQETLKPYFWVGEDILYSYNDLPYLSYDDYNSIFEAAKQIESKRKKIGELLNKKDHLGRNVNLFNQALAGLYKGKSIESIVNELISYDRMFHNPPYFTDPEENNRKLSEKSFCEELVLRAQKSVDKTIVPSKLDLICGKAGSPINNINNIIRVFEKDDKFKQKIWYDEFYCRFYSTLFSQEPREWSDIDVLNLTNLFQRDLNFLTLNDQIINKAVMAYAKNNIKNEPKDWISSLSWDGIPRIELFLHTALGCEDNEYSRSVSRNFFISMVARIFKPGCKVDSMLILEGDQGVGKSKMLNIIGGKWYCENNENISSKDFCLSLQGKLVVELSELDSFSKAEANTIKKVITCQVDRFRPPYGQFAQDFPRQCVFTGSTNDETYLKDPSGGRRFFPIKVKKIDLLYAEEVRPQLFAEAYQYFKDGSCWWDFHESAKEEQEARRDIDFAEDLLIDYLIGKTEISTKELYGMLFNGGSSCDLTVVDKMSQKRVGMAMKSLGWSCHVKKIHGKPQRFWIKKA